MLDISLIFRFELSFFLVPNETENMLVGNATSTQESSETIASQNTGCILWKRRFRRTVSAADYRICLTVWDKTVDFLSHGRFYM